MAKTQKRVPQELTAVAVVAFVAYTALVRVVDAMNRELKRMANLRGGAGRGDVPRC